MPKITDRMGDVRTRALEFGVYLPLGAYSRVKDGITDLNRPRLNKLFGDLIDRGQDRLQPIEKVVRRRGDDAQKTAKKAAKGAQTAVRKTTKKATAAGAAAAPKLPRIAAPKTASRASDQWVQLADRVGHRFAAAGSDPDRPREGLQVREGQREPLDDSRGHRLEARRPSDNHLRRSYGGRDHRSTRRTYEARPASDSPLRGRHQGPFDDSREDRHASLVEPQLREKEDPAERPGLLS